MNWLTSMYPMRNISAQPVRYFMYRSYISSDCSAMAWSLLACSAADQMSSVFA